MLASVCFLPESLPPSNYVQEAYDAFAQLAPAEANAIIAVQAATAAQSFSNDTFLYLTLIGTPAVVEPSQKVG